MFIVTLLTLMTLATSPASLSNAAPGVKATITAKRKREEEEDNPQALRDAVMFGSTPYRSPAGEEWRTISYPFFRISSKPHANRWVSSWGRLMRVDGEIVERQPLGSGYHRTGICVSRRPESDEDCIIGASIPVFVHQIVAYTFLGSPPHPDDTVDHIDGVPSNNCVDNLRWASSTVQLKNRTRTVYEFTLPDGTTNNSIIETARQLRVPQRTVADRSRHCVDGNLDIAGHDVKCKHLGRKSIPLYVENPRPLGGKRIPPASLTQTRVIQQFLAGRTCRDIWTSWDSPVQLENIINHIGNAITNGTICTTAAFIKRIGIPSPLHCRRMMADIDATLADLKTRQAPPGLQWNEAYANVVYYHLPHLDAEMNEWLLIKRTRTAILKVLDKHPAPMDSWKTDFADSEEETNS